MTICDNCGDMLDRCLGNCIFDDFPVPVLAESTTVVASTEAKLLTESTDGTGTVSGETFPIDYEHFGSLDASHAISAEEPSRSEPTSFLGRADSESAVRRACQSDKPSGVGVTASPETNLEYQPSPDELQDAWLNDIYTSFPGEQE